MKTRVGKKCGLSLVYPDVSYFLYWVVFLLRHKKGLVVIYNHIIVVDPIVTKNRPHNTEISKIPVEEPEPNRIKLKLVEIPNPKKV